MEEGRLLSVGTLEELRARVETGMKVLLKVKGSLDERIYRRIDDMTFETDIQSEAEIPGLVRRLVEAGGEVYHVSAKLPSLEDIYFTLTAHSGPDADGRRG